MCTPEDFVIRLAPRRLHVSRYNRITHGCKHPTVHFL